MIQFYAVCNVNGPISISLDGDTKEEAVDSFKSADLRLGIDSCGVDIEDDLGINGEGASEDEFADMLVAAGAVEVADLEPVINAHAGTVCHLMNGWTLWSKETTNMKKDSNVVHLTTNVSLLVSLVFNEKCKQAQESFEFDSIKAVFIQGARIMHRYAELKKDGWTLEFVSPDREKSIQVML